MLTPVYNTHKNNNKSNNKRVIDIAQLCLSAMLKIGKDNLMLLSIFRNIFPNVTKEQSGQARDKCIILKTYNKTNILLLGMLREQIKHKNK